MNNRVKLLDQVRNVMRARHYSYRTEESYIGWIRRFIYFYDKRHPREMGTKEIEAFLTDLAVHKKVAASTQNQAFNALLFLYREVLGLEFGDVDQVVRAKKPRKLPVVFTREEVRAVLSRLTYDKWLIGQLLYGAGLRVMECVRLRAKDVDFGYRQITVRDGKGSKDRVTMLPEVVISDLKKHLERVRMIHNRDLKAGFGSVYLPYALERSTETPVKPGPGSMCFRPANGRSIPAAG